MTRPVLWPPLLLADTTPTGPYALAFVVGGIIAWFWASHWVGSHKRYAILPGGLIWVLSSGAVSLLGHWGVETAGPEVGLFWAIGFVVGFAYQFHETLRSIVHGEAHDLGWNDRRGLKALARTVLLKSELGEAQGRVRGRAQEIRSLRQHEERAVLTEQKVADLQQDLRESRGRQELLKRLVDTLEHCNVETCATILATSIQSYLPPERPNKEHDIVPILQNLCDSIAKAFGEIDTVAASVYLFKPKGSAGLIEPYVCSGRSHRDLGPSHAWIVTDPLQRRSSILEACVTLRSVVCWPFDADRLRTDSRIRPPRGRRTNQQWPRGICVPVPFSVHRGERPGLSRDPYGIILVRFKDTRDAKPNAALQNFAVAAAGLVDLLLHVTGTREAWLGIDEKRR